MTHRSETSSAARHRKPVSQLLGAVEGTVHRDIVAFPAQSGPYPLGLLLTGTSVLQRAALQCSIGGSFLLVLFSFASWSWTSDPEFDAPRLSASF